MVAGMPGLAICRILVMSILVMAGAGSAPAIGLPLAAVGSSSGPALRAAGHMATFLARSRGSVDLPEAPPASSAYMANPGRCHERCH